MYSEWGCHDRRIKFTNGRIEEGIEIVATVLQLMENCSLVDSASFNQDHNKDALPNCLPQEMCVSYTPPPPPPFFIGYDATEYLV